MTIPVEVDNLTQPKPKLGIFFGAGAEIGYGLPSGGKFALDIFRTPPDEDRNSLRRQIQNINPTSIYATKWLPSGYINKRLHIFGKGEFEGLIASSLEYRRDEILSYIEEFDSNALKILSNWYLNEPQIREKFQLATAIELGSVLYGQVIRLNDRLADRVSLFESEFFSAFLKILELNPNNRNLSKTIRAFLELLVGAFGQRLVSRLNEELFIAAPDGLSVFDDMSGVFSLDYKTVGQTGMEIVLEGQPNPVNLNSSICEIFVELGRAILEDMFARAIDYQALIDSHFRYLYNPKAHWAKFTRISIFLHTVQRYISQNVNVDRNRIINGPGYYHDLVALTDKFDLITIGTTNYNNFIQQVLEISTISDLNVYHLNGGVHEYYDPYRNSILINPSEEEKSQLGHILVPFMFTQSGIKPLTSINISRRYVQLYDNFKKSDLICIIGYGFNTDDGHINGLLRALVENENKKLVILHHGLESIETTRREYQSKLRLSSNRNLIIMLVDDYRNVQGNIWYETLLHEWKKQM